MVYVYISKLLNVYKYIYFKLDSRFWVSMGSVQNQLDSFPHGFKDGPFLHDVLLCAGYSREGWLPDIRLVILVN